MKLIEKKEAVKTVPELIWGKKYVTTGKDSYYKFSVGTVVLLTCSTVDSDGDVEICTNERESYIKPEYLKPVDSYDKTAEKIVGRKYEVTGNTNAHEFPVGTVVTLVNDDGSNCPYFGDAGGEQWYVRMSEVKLLPEEPLEATYTVELTEAELQIIVAEMGSLTDEGTAAALERKGYPEELKEESYELWEALQELLEGGR